MQTATLSSKFQISIPKEIRKQLYLKVGQRFVFILKGSSLYLVPKRSINEVKGIMSGVNTENFRDHKDRA